MDYRYISYDEVMWLISILYTESLSELTGFPLEILTDLQRSRLLLRAYALPSPIIPKSVACKHMPERLFAPTGE